MTDAERALTNAEGWWRTSLRKVASYAQSCADGHYDFQPYEETTGHLRDIIDWAHHCGRQYERAKERFERQERRECDMRQRAAQATAAE